jgi:hypothetical protein
MTKQKELHWRGYLLHLTHYDPVWMRKKSTEKPFDPDVAGEVVETLKDCGFNMLLIGVSDGITYRSHPELKRRYSRPMKALVDLAAHARSLGMEIVPKLNFSRSEINCHNHWMRSPKEEWYHNFDDAPYFKRAFDCIDEVIEACRPKKFFHVGMDEDHDRSYTQYVNAILSLRAGLRKRRLRTVCWSDSAIEYASGQIHVEKCQTAERELPKDVVRLLWHYRSVPAGVMKTIRKHGYELWGAPGASELAKTVAFRDGVLACGGTGLVMTNWIPCRKENRQALLDRIRSFAPAYGVSSE